MYGHDHDGRLPWQILPSDQKVELGTGWHDFNMDPGAIFSLPPMKSEIVKVRKGEAIVWLFRTALVDFQA